MNARDDDMDDELREALELTEDDLLEMMRNARPANVWRRPRSVRNVTPTLSYRGCHGQWDNR